MARSKNRISILILILIWLDRVNCFTMCLSVFIIVRVASGALFDSAAVTSSKSGRLVSPGQLPQCTLSPPIDRLRRYASAWPCTSSMMVLTHPCTRCLSTAMASRKFFTRQYPKMACTWEGGDQRRRGRGAKRDILAAREIACQV